MDVCVVCVLQKGQKAKPEQRSTDKVQEKKNPPPPPPEAWMSVSSECCVLSGRGLCEGADSSSRGVLPTVVCRCVI